MKKGTKCKCLFSFLCLGTIHKWNHTKLTQIWPKIDSLLCIWTNFQVLPHSKADWNIFFMVLSQFFSFYLLIEGLSPPSPPKQTGSGESSVNYMVVYNYMWLAMVTSPSHERGSCPYQGMNGEDTHIWTGKMVDL